MHTRILVGKSEERPLGRLRSTDDDDIKMGLKEVKWNGVEWINLAHDRDRWWDFVNMVMNLRAA